MLKNKIGITTKNLFNQKRLLESKKEIVFTDKSIKEIAYDFGYNDPAYFNRVFKKNEGKSPKESSEKISYLMIEILLLLTFMSFYKVIIQSKGT